MFNECRQVDLNMFYHKDISVVFGMLFGVALSTFVYDKNGKKCALDNQSTEYCFTDDTFSEENEDTPMFYNEKSNEKEKENLFIWDPVHVGFERELDLGHGNKVKMVTESLLPKVFTIENFLTDEEADHIIAKSKHHGLETSKLHIDFKTKTDLDFFEGKAQDSLQFLDTWDHDRNGQIDMTEIIETARAYIIIYLNITEVEDMFAAMNMNELDDGVITQDEFENMNTAGLSQYLAYIKQNHPAHKIRYSNQIWLNQANRSNHIMANLREKVIKLTNLPRYIVEGGEPLQVVNYQTDGHYHAHYDGQDFKDYPDAPCCHLSLASQPNNCMNCRLLTIIYYLNDVTEGGETAFPVADKRGYLVEEFRPRILGELQNLSEFCHNASLVVKPKKGRAVMFYNQFLDKDGWMGAMDRNSLHGGCNIIKGEKWMANNWITAPPYKNKDEESLYSFMTPRGAF